MRQSLSISLLLLALAGYCSADTLYSEDLAWRLANPAEIKDVTNIRARLRKESKRADPLFVLTPPPFRDIPAAPNELGSIAPAPKSWELPPWPSVDPALPADLPEHLRRAMEERRGTEQAAEVWSELDPLGGSDRAPSALLRPRTVPLDQQFVFRVKEIPEPFSLRRYYDNEDIFIEIAAYGGTTSFKAEEAFRALKEAATKQQRLEGIGSEAFLTRLEITEEKPPEEALPFSDLPVQGEARPELMDSGKATALLAPAFQSVPVKDLEGRTVTYVEPNKRYRSEAPEVKHSLLVIVAFFPDRALTVSVALEERLGSVQDLVAMAMLVQSKVKNEIRPLHG